MDTSNFVTQLPHLAAAGIMLFLAGTVFLNTQSKNYTLPFALLALFVAIDTIGVVLDNLATVVWQKHLFFTISSVVIVMAVPMWLTFITLYTGHSHWLTRPVKWLIWSVSGVVAFACLTNYWHQWVIIIETTPMFSRRYGIISYLYLVYTVGAMIYGMILFWRAISTSRGVLRQQFILVLIGAILLDLGQSMLFIFSLDSMVAHILRPIFWFLSAFSFLFGIYRTRLLDMTPLSHKAFFVQVQTGFVACDEVGRIRAVNPAAIQILGEPSKKLIGQPCETAFSIFAEPLTDEMILSGKPFQYETQLVNHESDAAVWYHIEGSPLDKSGHQPGLSLILHDITQAKEAEKLRHSLTRMVYHDLSQPVSAILLYLKLVEKAHVSGNGEKHDKHLASAQEQGEDLLNMVQNLQTINQIETGSLQLEAEACDVAALIEQTLRKHQVTAQSQAITLTSSVAGSLPPIVLDCALIQRVLGNLISNAMRFTPKNGRVTVNLQPFKPDNSMMSISVTDTGVGIQTENPDELFHEGISLGERKSSGLGLAFCRMVVEAHGGRIWFENVPSGACITFSLPLTPSPSSARKSPVRTDGTVRR